MTMESHLPRRSIRSAGGTLHQEASNISLEAEVPEVLFDGMREFLRSHPQWDQYRLISSALSSFLFQHGCADQGVSQHYLNGLFLRR